MHTFDYGYYGNLTSWHLPTGASVTYLYKHYMSLPRSPVHSELVMKILASEDVDYRWSYTRFGDGVLRTAQDVFDYQEGLWASASNANKVRVLDPFDNLTVYWFHQTLFGSDNCSVAPFDECWGSWDDGLLYRVDRYAGPAEAGDRMVEQLLNHYTWEDYRFKTRIPHTPEGSLYTPDGYESYGPYDVPMDVQLESQETIRPGGGGYPPSASRPRTTGGLAVTTGRGIESSRILRSGERMQTTSSSEQRSQTMPTCPYQKPNPVRSAVS